MLLPQLQELLELRHQAQGLSLMSKQHVHTSLSGLYASIFRGQGMDFDEVREYRPGDEVRQIDWRVTARMGKPFLKIYREERERNVMLCVEQSPRMQFGTRGTFKSVQAARAAALLGWSAQAHGDRVGGLLFGQGKTQFFRPSRDQRGFWQLLRRLTIMPSGEANHTIPLEQGLSLLNRSTPTGTLLFVIADFQSIVVSALQPVLALLRERHELVLVAIDDPADSVLPAVGYVTFVNAAGQLITVNTDNPQGQTQYRRLWQTQRQQLTSMVNRLAIGFLSVRTDADVYQSLMMGLKQRAEKQSAHWNTHQAS